MIYANEFDAKTAYWLSRLPLSIDRIDHRSIEDVQAREIIDFRQSHFFAGIGGWIYALHLAGWPDDVPVWTGSCPCQPFSCAGKRKGEQDERHLWPIWIELIRQCTPPFIFGEQVASAEVVGTQLEADFAVAVRSGEFARANKLAKRLVAKKSFGWQPRWIDRVQADLEKAGYTVRFGILGAHSVGAPHIRQRLFWVAQRVADDGSERSSRRAFKSAWEKCETLKRSRDASGMAHSGRNMQPRPRQSGAGRLEATERTQPIFNVESCSVDGRMEHTKGDGRQQGRSESSGRISSKRLSDGGLGNSNGGREGSLEEISRRSRVERTGSDEFWSVVDYLPCSDGKHRPVEPGTFPLAHGIPGRVAQLRGLGNAIVPQVAAAFIRSVIEVSR